MIKPKFITFTGADAWTDIDQMIALADQYPIEWGILFSPSRQGVENRYPEMRFVDELVRAQKHFDFNLAAHVCGHYSRQVLDSGSFSVEGYGDFLRARSHMFRRVQINTNERMIDIDVVLNGTLLGGVADHTQQVIFQTRKEFPSNSHYPQVAYLFDQSGGRGVVSSNWPTNPTQQMVGYAGGINSANVEHIVSQIRTGGSFWIDMESGVRDSTDHFSLSECRRVCEKIFGV